MKNAPQLDFYRYEFKYLVDNAMAEEIEAELQSCLMLDAFVQKLPGSEYPVRSLYFDDPSYSAYYAKIDGVKKRSKFRLRTYSSDHHIIAPTFLEIKGRHNALVYKHRTPLAHKNKHLCSIGQYALINNIVKRVAPGPVRDRFVSALKPKQIHSVLVIEYNRRPYYYMFDNSFRVTFDRNIIAKPGNELHSEHVRPYRSVHKGYTVIEIKFSYGVPQFFAKMIKYYQLERVSISKIVEGINIWNLAPRLE